MKNDENVFPVSGKKVALFGFNAYVLYPYAASDFKAGNDDAVDLVQVFRDAGIESDQTVMDFYKESILNEQTGADGKSAYDYIYVTSPGDMTTYQINATEALPRTYVADDASTQAVQNFGGGYYVGYEVVNSDGDDPCYPGATIENAEPGSFGGASPAYN